MSLFKVGFSACFVTFGGTLVMGAGFGAVVAGPGGLFYGLVGGVFLAIPASYIALLFYFAEAWILRKEGADSDVVRRSFVISGALLGPILAMTPFLLAGSPNAGDVIPIGVVAALLGAAGGLLVHHGSGDASSVAGISRSS